jgi:hypothetical protein
VDGGIWAWMEPAVAGVVANMCEGKLILCIAYIQLFESILGKEVAQN